MAQLFGARWARSEGDALEGSDFTPRFLLWCRKTEALRDEDWARGFEVIEYRVGCAGRDEKAIFPPSYAEFVGLCQPPVGIAAHRKFAPLQLEDKTAIQKRRAMGRERCSALLDFLGE